MFSFTTLTLFSSLFAAQTLAAPTTFLNKRQDTTSCYPTAGFTTTINGISTRDAWAVEEKNGFPIAVSLQDTRSYAEDASPIQLNITRSNDSNDQYRIVPANAEGSGKCLAATCNGIASADCDSPLSAWTIECGSCTPNSGKGGQHCLFRSTELGTCVETVEFGQNLTMKACKSVTDDEGYLEAGDQFYQF